MGPVTNYPVSGAGCGGCKWGNWLLSPFSNSPRCAEGAGIDPTQPLVQALLGGAGEPRDLDLRVNGASVGFGHVDVKWHVRQQVDFSEQHQLRLEEDAGVFERLLFAFRHAQQHDFTGFAEIVAGGAHQVTHVFNEEKIDLREVPAIERAPDHASVQVAGAGGGD